MSLYQLALSAHLHYARLLAVNWANVSDPIWWAEIYIHFNSFCSLFLRFFATPFMEWADSKDGSVYVSKDRLAQMHSIYELISKFGALNKRPELLSLRTNDGVRKDADNGN